MIATFELAPHGEAAALALEESLGTEGAVARLGARFGGEVLDEGGGRATIAWPWTNWGANVPQLLASVIAGEGSETARFTRCRLVAIHLPQDLLAALGAGPAFGLAGVRSLLGTAPADRPLLGGIVKPSLGLAPAEVAEVAVALARGGCDLVKDDELLGDPPWCPLDQRVRAVASALEASGVACLYAANVTGPSESLVDRAGAAVAAGATAIMVNAFAQGLDAVRWLAQAGLGVPLFAHRVGSGPLARNGDFGIRGDVLCLMTRVLGADFVQIGGFGGKLFDGDEQVARNLLACRRPLLGRSGAEVAAPVPVNGGGVWAGAVPGILAEAGDDVLILGGSKLIEHPGGAEAGAISMCQAIEGCRGGLSLDRAADRAPELAIALACQGTG
ncbi:MAG: RuBisCO large subunit C-terminal-like domain-containing protein [Acidimicrobiia bacterium]